MGMDMWAVFVVVVVPLIATIASITFTWLKKLDDRLYELNRISKIRLDDIDEKLGSLDDDIQDKDLKSKQDMGKLDGRIEELENTAKHKNTQ